MNKYIYKDVVKWQRDTFPGSHVYSKLQHLKKEIKEVETAKSFDEAKEELADCFILLMGACDSLGLNYSGITEAIQNKMRTNKLRKWGTPDENGVVLHIKNEMSE